MLQRIRDHVSGWGAAVVLGLIAVVFVFWGIDFKNAATSYGVRVNGEKIPLQQLQRSWQERLSQLQQASHGALPDEVVKAQQQALVDDLVRQKLLTQRADDLGYRASNALLAETIQQFPELQVDGKFSRDRYAALLRAQGRTEPQFEADLRRSLAISQLQNGIVLSSFLTPGEVTRRVALTQEERQIDYAIVSAASLAADITAGDADIAAYYEAHKADFMTPESVTLEYVELTLDDVAGEVEVTEDGLRSYYEQVKDRFETPERRRARHILIESGKDDAAAKAKAEEIAEKIRAGGDFAALAREFSQDPGSAKQGGELGWASRGMYVGPFEEALFSMKAGELRGPVKTQFGYHVIQLEEIDPGKLRSFEDVRQELEAEYRRDQAASAFYDKSQQLADEAFAALTDLDSAAAAVGQPVKKAPGFTRSGGEPFDANRDVIDAAFSGDVLEEGHNSPLITLADDRVVVLRATDHRMPEQESLDSVRDDIAATLRDAKAREAARARGETLTARLASGAQWPAALGDVGIQAAGEKFVARKGADVPAEIVTAAFAVPRAEVVTPVYRGAELANGDYAIVRVIYVREGGTGQDAASQRARMAQQGARTEGFEEFAAYVTELERAATIDRNPAAFE
jgi:peptidyl-prolyl cis-trans isomerase D